MTDLVSRTIRALCDPLLCRMPILLGALADRRGVSAIEFAMIFPVMLLLYSGTVEMGTALTINRRVATIATSAADIVAQEKTTTTPELQDVAAAGSRILDPYSSVPLKIVLTSVVADQNNVGKVDWSYASPGGTPRAKNSTYPTPTGLTQANSSVIVAEVTYDFTPMLNLKEFFSPGSYRMKHTFYSRPRKSTKVTKSD